MTDPTQTPLAILFADVCGSTRLYDRLGDVRAQDAVARCLSIMAEATRRNRGQVIKTIGDEVMSTFARVDDAAQAAAEMQEDIADTLVVEGEVIALRIGFHFGPTLREGNDVFGDAVNIAARLTAEAKPAQILTTAVTVEQMTPLWQACTRKIDTAALKGRSDVTEICEVMWQREEATRMITALGQQHALPESRQELDIQHAEASFRLGDDRKVLSMGRGRQNDLVVAHGLISRLHARIEVRVGHFVIVDQSINGTYLHPDNGQPYFLRRDSVMLSGSGWVGLGQPPAVGTAHSLRYRCVPVPAG